MPPDSTRSWFPSMKASRCFSSLIALFVTHCNLTVALWLQLSARSSLVDGKVIDGHVIPNTVIFTAAAQHDDPKASAAFEDLLKVTVSFFKQKNGKSKIALKTYHFTKGLRMIVWLI